MHGLEQLGLIAAIERRPGAGHALEGIVVAQIADRRRLQRWSTSVRRSDDLRSARSRPAATGSATATATATGTGTGTAAATDGDRAAPARSSGAPAAPTWLLRLTPPRRSRTFRWTTRPVDLALGRGHHGTHHLAHLLHRLAPVEEIASSISASTSASESCSGAKGCEDLAFGPLLLGELGATRGLERLDRLGALLDLLARDLANLVVGELVEDLLLAVRDRGGRACGARRAEPCRRPGAPPSSARAPASFSVGSPT